MTTPVIKVTTSIFWYRDPLLTHLCDELESTEKYDQESIPQIALDTEERTAKVFKNMAELKAANEQGSTKYHAVTFKDYTKLYDVFCNGFIKIKDLYLFFRLISAVSLKAPLNAGAELNAFHNMLSTVTEKLKSECEKGLFGAVSLGEVENVKYFLSLKIPLDFKLANSDDNLIFVALRKGHVEIAELLISKALTHCEDILYKENHGETILHLAARYNYNNIVKLLYLKKLPPRQIEFRFLQNINKKSPIIIAAENGSTESLVTMSEGILYSDIYIEKFFKIAVNSGHWETAYQFLKHVDTNKRYIKGSFLLYLNRHNKTLLDYAREYDAVNPNSQMEKKLSQLINPLTTFSFFYNHISNEMHDSFYHSPEKAIDRRVPINFLHRVLNLMNNETAKLLRTHLEDLENAIASINSKESDKEKREFHETFFKNAKGNLDGLVKDLLSSPDMILSSLEASINSIRELMNSNEALTEKNVKSYFPSVIISFVTAIRKIRTLKLVGNLDDKTKQKLLELEKQLDAVLEFCKLEYKKINEADSASNAVKVAKPLSRSHLEEPLKMWDAIKETLHQLIKVNLKPQPPKVFTEEDAKTEAEEAEEELNKGLKLQERFLSWEQTHSEVSQIWKKVISDASKGKKWGKEVEETVQNGLLDQSGWIGLMLLDQLMGVGFNFKKLPVFFQKVSSASNEEENKEKMEKVEKSNKALTTALNDFSEVMIKEKWAPEKIAQLLLIPTEDQKQKASTAEKSAMTAFNTIVSIIRLDAITFNAITKFLIWPILSPESASRFNQQVTQYEENQRVVFDAYAEGDYAEEDES